MGKIKFLSLIILWTIGAVALQAQNDRQHVRKGNQYFRKGDMANAALEYQKALSANESNTQAIYNLGVTALQQGNDSLAVEQFKLAGKMEPNKFRKAQAYHNIGVVMQMHQQYGEAIEAYKEALRNNPADDETRYNLVLCKRQQKQDQQDQKNQNNQNNKDNDKNQDKNKDQKQNQDKNQDKDKQDQNQNQQPQQQQMSQENAERLLDAAIQEEKRTQDKLQKAMQLPKRRSLQKNW